MEITITKENFEEVVLKNELPVLVDFWAPWCGPCKMLGPIIEEIAKEKSGEVVVGKVNVDDEQDLAVRYGVMSIPTVIVFNKGEIVNQNVGFVPKAQLEAMLPAK
ncbi:thioredoxin [Ruminococcaceae bacterium OttesenSCG-928-N02]|nr:thioredoxin [Ruminococcaceae bacterium OttesenSCG-928-N02]